MKHHFNHVYYLTRSNPKQLSVINMKNSEFSAYCFVVNLILDKYQPFKYISRQRWASFLWTNENVETTQIFLEWWTTVLVEKTITQKQKQKKILNRSIKFGKTIVLHWTKGFSKWSNKAIFFYWKNNFLE